MFRVYVRQKKPLAELRPEETIPPEIDGIKTDVIVLQDIGRLCKTNLEPGMQITREIPNYVEGSGTLGCIVRKGSKAYILTNQHVIVPDGTGGASTDVYQPKKSTCAGLTCNSPVAKVVGEATPWAAHELRTVSGKPYWLDCGLLEINSGIAYENKVAGNPLQGAVRDLSTEASEDVPAGPGPPPTPPGTRHPTVLTTLRKLGMKTALTTGTVVELCHETSIGGTMTLAWEMVILPTAASYNYDKTYRIRPDEIRPLPLILQQYTGTPVTATRVNPGDPSDRRIRFTGRTFALKGDSGSVCIDDAQRATGLLHSVEGLNLSVEDEDGSVFVPAGRGIACHIRPAMIELGLDPNTAIVVGASTTSGAAIQIGPGDALTEQPPTPGDLDAALARLDAGLRSSHAGRRLIAIFDAHHRELIDLVNHRRRVTVAWQRMEGPAFVAAALDAIRVGAADTEVPRTVGGHSLDALLARMLAVLRQEGSSRLKHAIDDDGEFLSEIVSRCDRFDDVMAILDDHHAVSAPGPS